ncbi:hypothetical protein G7Y89_g15761 [Cudoniella acicularis]|uniref:Uncharacterized protein n=1 Tax=Cudoniella acicularis TaxID=354080 RepID=A0A8H4QG51_9HELO|nr:hypothetical protein G7Y89_g15761 [Cudoniella acicularis]
MSMKKKVISMTKPALLPGKVVDQFKRAPSNAVFSRIQTCIQRYRARRKLDAVRSNIFTKYLILGGIEATGKQFTGGALDEETLEQATAEEIAALQATDYIRSGNTNSKYYDPAKPDGWVVDFEGVAKGFLVPHQLGPETETEIKQCTAVIRNFLNYILQHAVCPEYTLEVMAARRVCDLAEKELWALQLLTPKLPGDFNVAASTICGGHYQGLSLTAEPWQKDDPEIEQFLSINGMDEAQAKSIFRTGIAFAGTDELFTEAMKGEFYIIASNRKYFEIVDIERPSVKLIREYSRAKGHHGELGNIKPLGAIRIKSWEGPGLDEEDASDDENPKTEEARIESFWLEDDILQLLFVGLKLELLVHELNIGIKFFDTVLGTYCSFFTYLENEKMLSWKEPVENTRPPPTEDDPDIEERAMEAIMEGEVNDDEKITSN